MSRRPIVAALVLLLTLGSTTTACSGRPEPLRDAREALGTIVSLTAYTASGDEGTAEEASRTIDAAYDAMAQSETALDAYASEDWFERRFELGYDPGAMIVADSVLTFNTNPFPWRLMPTEAERVFERIEALGVTDSFSAGLLEVTALYDFENGGRVPSDEVLAYYTAIAQTLEWRLVIGGTEARFHPLEEELPAAEPEDSPYRMPRAGLDLGGAAKGHALDQAAGALGGSNAIAAALVTAGSTTVAIGEKPDEEPWRIGIEDPRELDRLVATVEAPGPVTVSTSGDYQRFFERDGVRYHHILDPATGRPARGLRSLSVVGARSGLDSDILATSLFVMGRDSATAYAEKHGLGLVLVDDEGRVHVVPGPEDRTWKIVTSE